MKNLLITILLFLSSVSLSHAGLFGPSNYEECVLENVKTAQTKESVQVVIMTCLDKFPQKVIPALPKLSKGIKANLVCTYVNNETFILTVDPRNKLYDLVGNNKISGRITIITTDTIYGISKWDQGTEKRTHHFSLNTTTGRLGGRVEVVRKDGKTENIPVNETCSEEK